MRFENKVVFITGAAAGIGKAVVRAFAAAGANCVATDVSQEGLDQLRAEIGDLSGRLQLRRCDVTAEDQVEAAVASTVERFGRLDILVCCAGGSGMTAFYKTEAGKESEMGGRDPSCRVGGHHRPQPDRSLPLH